MRKPASMILEDWRNQALFSNRNTNEVFKVLKLKNTTQYIAGEFITLSEVNQRIQAGWDITIQPKK
jgi:N-formylglutamate amidohydrolase